ncbi:MAG: allophanate hydrolase, partial [Acidimicrobiaceae bacterium]
DDPSLPLAGLRLAVKDNIDVEGWTTTAGHPGLARHAERSAPVVRRLIDAGAVVVGKTNMDQLATGLVGTRSPYGVCANAIDPTRIAGGSSSGSAVAVALGEADLSLGTDTAGSGRVPAALNGIVGLKPTRGLLSTTGVVPASRSLDCVSVFARDVGLAARALTLATAFDPDDEWSRRPPRGTPTIGRAPLRIGVPRAVDLEGGDAAALDAWKRALPRLDAIGELVEIDLGPYLRAGALLYGSALVADRWVSFGEALLAHPEGADPTVTAIVTGSRDLLAHHYAADLLALRTEAAAWATVIADVDVVALPTVGEAPTLAEVAADPIGVSVRLGRFTNGCNLLDLCAAAVPCGARDDGIPFGVTFLGPAFADPVVAVAGARLLGEPDPSPPAWAGWTTIVVVGAHLRGQPLNHQLTSLGGAFVADVQTAPSYALHALATEPRKPGLVRVAPDRGRAGASIAAELWVLPTDGFGAFVAAVPPPLCIGTVALDDGTSHAGFLCEGWAAEDAPDITQHGGWLNYLASR